VYGGDTVAPPGNQAVNGEHKLHAYSTEDLSLLDKNACGLTGVVLQEPPSRSRHGIGPRRSEPWLTAGKDSMFPWP
jgi:hypothetical protein